MATQRLLGNEDGTVSSAQSKSNSAQPTVRRLIVYTLLFALVVIGAIGLSGLLGRLLGASTELAAGDLAGLARSLAFTLVGGPFAAVLWWVVWRRTDDDGERSSLGRGLYLAGMSAVSLITFSTALLITASSLVVGDWRPRDLSTGLVWAGVWAWQRWMRRHAPMSPTRLAHVPTVVGYLFGLVLGVGGTVTALGGLLDAAIRGFAGQTTVGEPWWRFTLQALVWAIGGVAIWWWHWIHDDGRHLRTRLADVALICFGVLGGSVLTLGGAGVIVFVSLRLGFDRTDPISQLLDPLAPAIAAAAIGSLVWSYHWRIAHRRSDATLHATRLVTSGVALVATASGIGVIVNSLLATVTTAVAGFDPRTLLLAGISSLVVGGPVWWQVWKPAAPAEPARIGSTGRRVTLIAVFGLSAVVALITLLVIGYRVFEFVLDNVTGEGLVNRIRAPLGLLVATGLVAGYHFSVWRRDRLAMAAAAPVRSKTIGQVILVTASNPESQMQVIDEVTGASVTVWMRTDIDARSPADGPNDDQLARALDGVTGKRVLVVTGPGERVDVIPLAG